MPGLVRCWRPAACLLLLASCAGRGVTPAGHVMDAAATVEDTASTPRAGVDGAVPDTGGPLTIRFVREIPEQPDATRKSEWKAVVTHTHNLRSRELNFEEAKQGLVEWSQKLGIAALGVGSPWEPVSAAAYRRYEGRDRNRYYAGEIDPASVMNQAQIGQLFNDLNAKSGGHTLFYQDNETPKSRMGHTWWFGYHYDVPAWHDYSQDRPVQYWKDDPDIEINPITNEPQRRRSLLEITAIQRKAGALGVFAHPTSWWLDGDRFITNIAAPVGLFLMADGYLDGLTIMGYNASRRWYQGLWFSLLDTGAIVPGFAEVDWSLDSRQTLALNKAYINYLHIPGQITVANIVAAAKKGAGFASTGAFLTLSVDGVPMGQIAPTAAGQVHRLRIEAAPHPDETGFSRVDVVGPQGTVLASREAFAGGVLEYDLAGQDTPHYVVVRAYGQNDDPDTEIDNQIQHLAISNPVYLHPQGFVFEPVTTSFTLDVTPTSAWIGGTVEFQQADGTVIAQHPVAAGALRVTLPASARVSLRKDSASEYFYIAMENPRVQTLLAYLYSGAFRADYTDLKSGQVPASAFRLPEMREALQESTYVLD